MEGDKRREQIIAYLTKSNQPISGTELAKILNVSRQVIVQDIALLRVTDLEGEDGKTQQECKNDSL